MPDNTILCWRTHTTVGQVKAWIDSDDHTAIGQFLWDRFDERYFAPFASLEITERNGFMIMAVCCLAIEALESFQQGWESTQPKGMSQLAFCSFFDREAEFHVLKGKSPQFYKHVRCGILHQAETTGGWTITRMPGKPLFDPQGPRIQADEFHAALSRSLKSYTDEVKISDPTHDIWKNCLTKLNAIIRNCG